MTRKADTAVKDSSSNLKAAWQQALQNLQDMINQVYSKSQRIREIESLIRTAAREERRLLVQERQDTLTDLEALPYEVGAAQRDTVLALGKYLLAENGRLVDWEDRLNEVEKQAFDATTGSYPYPATFDEERNALERDKKAFQEFFKESGLEDAWWRWYGHDWKNESTWNEYASKRQKELVHQALNIRDRIIYDNLD